MMKTKYWMLLLFCLPLFAINSTAQGWERTYTNMGGTAVKGVDVIETPDGGFFVTGWIPITGIGMGSTTFIKVDLNGNEQWSNSNIHPANGRLLATYNGNYLVANKVEGPYSIFHPLNPAPSDTYIHEIDILGNTVRQQSYDFLFQEGLVAIKPTIDSGFVFIGGNEDTATLAKIDTQLNTVWTQVLPGEKHLKDIIETSTKELVYVKGNFGLVKTDDLGNQLWAQSYANLSNGGEFKRVVEAADGGYVLAGSKIVNANLFPLIIKTDTSGNILWVDSVGTGVNINNTGGITDFIITTRGDYVAILGETALAQVSVDGIITKVTPLNELVPPIAAEIKETTDGGFVVLGTLNDQIYLAKTDSSLTIYSNTIAGNVFDDLNIDCNKDSTDLDLSNWIIQVRGTIQGANQTAYTTTDSMGYYSIVVDTGQYTVGISPISVYWDACQDSHSVVFTQPYVDTIIDFAMQKSVSCPLMKVDISTPFLRRCFSNNYTVSYCNLGTITGQNAYVEVELDSFLTYNSSTIPFVSQVGNVYRFDIGNVAVGDCGSFNINVTVDCNTTILGQAHCVEAHIYPDTICIPNYWNGPIINVEAACLGDSVRFDIINSGAAMPTTQDYIVTEDNIMLRNSTYQLGVGGQTSIYQPTQQGATYRIIADQAAGFPFLLGDPFATAVVEGCKTNLGGAFNTGYVTNMSNGNLSPYIAVDCQENIGSYDPNDKQAQPVGYGLEHYISANTALDYKIRFQNTGTDTAFTVRIIDNLSEHLDPATLEMGASSHDYTFTLSQKGRLEVLFSNIELPDSNTNEPASHGFVKFKVQQRPNNPVGTQIENTAAIYFDYNAPILTNTTLHTIGNGFIISGIQKVATSTVAEEVQVTVIPNPMQQYATVQLTNLATTQQATLRVFNALGQEVERLQSNTGVFQLVNKGWTAGMYIYQIEVDQTLIGTGKIMIR